MIDFNLREIKTGIKMHHKLQDYPCGHTFDISDRIKAVIKFQEI